jgi:transposase InsO family protein
VNGAPAGWSGSPVRSPGINRGDAVLLVRLRELAGQHRRFGYRRLHAPLRREGLVIHCKRIYRLYKAEELALRRRRLPERELLRLIVPQQRSQRWSMDFASHALWTGRRFRCGSQPLPAHRRASGWCTTPSVLAPRAAAPC